MHYYIGVWADVDATVYGPFDDQETRDSAAKAWLQDESDEGSVFGLDVDADGVPSTWAYSSDFMES